ncbi:MAG: type II secretion system protein [Eubacteriales bacterium]|nr:type II secretion system protein [Eubacteriales bacterium]
MKKVQSKYPNKAFSLKSKAGMTLVEVILSLAILSMIAVLISSVMGLSFKVSKDSYILGESGSKAAAGIESRIAGFEHDPGISVVDAQEGIFTISFSGQEAAIAGNFIRGSDNDGNAVLRYFEPQ